MMHDEELEGFFKYRYVKETDTRVPKQFTLDIV